MVDMYMIAYCILLFEEYNSLLRDISAVTCNIRWWLCYCLYCSHKPQAFNFFCIWFDTEV